VAEVVRSPLLYLVAVLLVGCTPAVTPDGGTDATPPPPSLDASPVDASTDVSPVESSLDASPVATTIYNELVEAGCMAPNDPTGPSALAQSLAAGDFPWLPCLFDGGTVTSCNVPCE